MREKIALFVLGLGGLWMWWLVGGVSSSNLKLVFCDVGQGDAVLVVYKSVQVLIDGGPNDKVLSCLEGHMPFFDRKIEIVAMTHPQADHMNGLIKVLQNYEVGKFIDSGVANSTRGYRDLREELEAEKKTGMEEIVVYAGEKISLNPGFDLEVVWPEENWAFDHRSPQADGEVLGMASTGTDLNSFSVGLKLIFGRFSAIFTGDADLEIEEEMLEEGYLSDVDVFKIPHHGSRTGMSEKMLLRVKPELAIISVGKNNSYGHPTEVILEMLKKEGIKVLRTDRDREVVVESDGENWWVNE